MLDARVVHVPMAYHRTLDMPSSLQPFFVKSLTNELRVSDHAGAYDPGIQEERVDHANPRERNHTLPGKHR